MISKWILFVFSLLIVAGLFAQNTADTPEELKKKISAIRKNTNWENPEEAKRTNDSIKILSKKLSKIYQQQNAPADETEEEKTTREENLDYKEKLLGQIFESISNGEGADILLGEPVRKEIAAIYKEQEEQKKNPAYYEEMNFLCLDMSSPEVQKIIDVMQNFRSIKTMIITGGKFSKPADLTAIFSKAANYPLEQLYIINFKQQLKTVPSEVLNYKNLSYLSLVNNSIAKIPSFNSLQHLNTLFVDVNPVSTIISSISSLKQLEKLGIGKTTISATEKASLKQLLPNCQIPEP
jgi:mRNA-degrading endonuclease HigB of HigAB toxin-antitoxin module